MNDQDSSRSILGSILGRRRRSKVARPHRVGPLRLSDDEQAVITVAATLAKESPGAYIAAAALAVARGEIAPLPIDERERLRELMRARGQLTAILADLPRDIDQQQTSPPALTDQTSASLSAQRITDLLTEIEHLVRRLDRTITAWLRDLESQ